MTAKKESLGVQHGFDCNCKAQTLQLAISLKIEILFDDTMLTAWMGVALGVNSTRIGTGSDRQASAALTATKLQHFTSPTRQARVPMARTPQMHQKCLRKPVASSLI